MQKEDFRWFSSHQNTEISSFSKNVIYLQSKRRKHTLLRSKQSHQNHLKCFFHAFSLIWDKVRWSERETTKKEDHIWHKVYLMGTEIEESNQTFQSKWELKICAWIYQDENVWKESPLRSKSKRMEFLLRIKHAWSTTYTTCSEFGVQFSLDAIFSIFIWLNKMQFFICFLRWLFDASLFFFFIVHVDVNINAQIAAQLKNYTA